MGNKYNVCIFIRFIPVIKLGIREKEEEEEEKEKRRGEGKARAKTKKKPKVKFVGKKQRKPAKVKKNIFRWGGLRPEGGRFFTREPRGLRLR